MSGVLESVVFSVLASDRPGLVEELSALVNRCQGNWLGSHLSSVGGCFGGIVQVQVPRGEREAFTAGLQELASTGIDVLVRSAAVEGGEEQEAHVVVNIVGNDRPGIVSRVSEAIARHGVNIVELETECSSAPMTGNSIFTARARLVLPAGGSFGALKLELEQIANDLMVDVSLGD